MPSLEPVDYDPFARLTPVDYDPWDGRPMPSTYEESRMDAAQRRLEPVDHDPFSSAPAPSSRAQEKFNKITDAVAAGAKNWIETPGRAMREGVTTDQAVDWAAPTALGMMGVGAPVGMVSGGNKLGVFGGLGAQTADMQKLSRAIELDRGGASRDAIWHGTGWFKGADGHWRFEIPGDDRAAVFGLLPDRQVNSAQPIGDFSKEVITRENRGLRYKDVVQHPELYSAYPEMPEKLAAVHPLSGGARGSMDRQFGIMRLDEKLDPWDARSVGLHELQHSVQGREGFARGGNPEMFTQQAEAKLARDALSLRRELDALPSGMDRSAKENAIRENYKSLGIEDWLPSQEAWNVAHDRVGNPDAALSHIVKVYNLDKSVTPASPTDIYRRLAGEVEARNVQGRKDMTDYERKMTPPWKTEDTPPDQQLIVSGGNLTFGDKN